MKFFPLFLAVACAALVAGCGAGGGVNPISAPPQAPPPAPPPPAPQHPSPPPPTSNLSLADLQPSQSLTNDAVTSHARIDTAAKTTLSTSVQNTTLAISYDAGSKSYTVSIPTRSETFGTGDIFTSSDDSFINYHKVNA